MEHEYWEERVQGLVDNELSPADLNAVEAHIAQCQECAAHLAYFRSMKKRLAVHANSVTMPKAVEHRLNKLFERKRRGYRRFWLPALGSALAAAALALFMLLPKDGNRFVPGDILGKITCVDCEVAAHTGLSMGELCKDGHKMGVIEDNGTIWRFAADENGVNFIHHMDYMGKKVEVQGEFHGHTHLLRIRGFHLLDQRQAGL